jgi:hypothetical protein
MLPGLKTSDGSLYITEEGSQPSDVFLGGLRMTPEGIVRATENAPQVFANGFGVSESGPLCISFGGVMANYQQGLPFTADGRLVCQLNQPVSPGDAFVGGIRVGPLGGVYVTDTTPVVPFSFSNGFSNGFDIKL